MRKVLSFAAAVLLLTAAAAVNNAYALGVANSTQTASVFIPVSAGTFSWTISLKKVSDNAAANQITWDTITAIGTPNNWKNANVYAAITSTLTVSNAKLEIYQDNVNSAIYKATHTFEGNGIDKTFNGLVLSTTSAGHTNGSQGDLPFAWRISTGTAIASQTINPDSFVGMYFIDRSDTQYNSAANKAYRTVLSKDGMRYGGGAAEIGGSPSGAFYMYFGAKFDKAMAGQTYGSDRIIFRGFTE